MSQETLVSQTRLSDSPKPAISWFPARRPSGYEALPFEENSEDDDSDVKPVPFPASTQRNSETSPKDAPSSPRTSLRMFVGVLKMAVILLAAGLPATLFFSAFSWIIGGIVLSSIVGVPPYDSMDVNGTFKASMAGAPVISLAVGALAFLDAVLRRRRFGLGPNLRADRQLGSTSTSTAYNAAMDALAISSVCAPLSVLAMPLGLLMMPHRDLATETFGAGHALAVSATGFGVLVGGLLLRFLPELLWCDTVDL